MHQLRSARKAPRALPMPAAAITEEADEAIPVEEPLMPLQLSALEAVAAGPALPEEACAGEETAPSPLAEKPSSEGSARKETDSGQEAIQVAVRAGPITDSPLPVIKVAAHPRLANEYTVPASTCSAALPCMLLYGRVMDGPVDGFAF